MAETASCLLKRMAHGAIVGMCGSSLRMCGRSSAKCAPSASSSGAKRGTNGSSGSRYLPPCPDDHRQTREMPMKGVESVSVRSKPGDVVGIEQQRINVLEERAAVRREHVEVLQDEGEVRLCARQHTRTHTC